MARRCSLLLAGCLLLVSCTDWIYEDRTGCEHGVYLSFRYDYNLQRADMFADHVGEVTVYVFDEAGRYVTRQSESNTASSAPLKDKDYRMYIDLPAGSYRFIALAGQKSESSDARPRFRRNEPIAGDGVESLSVELEHSLPGEGGFCEVAHNGLPLDTLWHGMNGKPLDVPADRYVYDTLSLVRDTKYVSVSLREAGGGPEMDVTDYDFRIMDSNLLLRHDNSVDHSLAALYTPFATWNTSDSSPEGTPDGQKEASLGHTTAHADFMTSRLMWQDEGADNARLVVTHRDTQREVINVDLADLLTQLRTSVELQLYGRQEFLDRAYDYSLTFYLVNGKLSSVTIGVLGWSKRIQYEDL